MNVRDETGNTMAQVDRLRQREFVLKAWSALRDEAKRRGHRLAIFGAGQHTRWLLSELDQSDLSEIDVILDDNGQDGETIRGVPVRRPGDTKIAAGTTVIVSSDRFEDVLVKRCRASLGRRARIRRIYRGRRFVAQNGKMVPYWSHSKLVRCLRNMTYWPERRWGPAQRFVRRFYATEETRQWHDSAQPPHWADHRIDLALWPERGDPEFLERGVYAREVMRPGDRVLDLCCGDGFFAYYFYSGIAARVDAVDMDADALACARRHHAAQNIAHYCINVTDEGFWHERYDVICWDGALAHFGTGEIEVILERIATAIGADGVLCGSEEIEPPGEISWDHKIALTDAEKLRSLLAPHFKHVRILELNRRRRIAYFRCAQNASRLDGFV